MVQEGKPIAFVSKALMLAETRYVNIKRELLAVVYRYEKFHKSRKRIYTKHQSSTKFTPPVRIQKAIIFFGQAKSRGSNDDCLVMSLHALTKVFNLSLGLQ